MGSIGMMSAAGDEEVIAWEPGDEEAVKEAHKRFDDLKAKGFEFFEAAVAKGKRIKKFKPDLGKIIAAPVAQAEAGGRGMRGGPLARVPAGR